MNTRDRFGRLLQGISLTALAGGSWLQPRRMAQDAPARHAGKHEHRRTGAECGR